MVADSCSEVSPQGFGLLSGNEPDRVRRVASTVGMTQHGGSVPVEETPQDEVLEDVTAEVVEINQGGAGTVTATTVTINQGGAQAIEAKEVSIAQGGALFIESANADLRESGVGLLATDTAHVRESGIGVAVADTLHADRTMIGVLFAGCVEGSPNVQIDARSAAAFGAGFAAVLILLGRLLRRG